MFKKHVTSDSIYVSPPCCLHSLKGSVGHARGDCMYTRKRMQIEVAFPGI